MIKKLVEFVTTQTPFSILWEDDKKENGYKTMIITRDMTIPSREEIDSIIEHWKSLKEGNCVFFGKDSVNITFVDGEDKEEVEQI